MDDFRYLYSANNGSRSLITGMAEDKALSYYSTVYAPDVFPSLNIIRHKYDTKGCVAIGQDFLVGTDRSIERIRIYDNDNAQQEDEYLNVGLTNQDSIIKMNDDEIAFMSYQGAYLVTTSGRQAIYIGKHLRNWWLDTFTKAQMEACVGGYNYLNEELWFSFPTYTTAPYTTGIIFVFDIKAYREQYISPWWIINTDTKVRTFDVNNQLHLIGGGTGGDPAVEKVLDFDGDGSESVFTSYKIKLLQNGVPNKRVRWDRAYIDVDTDDTVTCNIYVDGATTATATLSLNSDLNTFIRYLSKTLEVEIITSTSTNSVEHKGMLLTFSPKRVI